MRLRPLPALTDNYIWLLDDGRHALAVDPGDARPLLQELAASGLSLKTILLTHHHADHIAGVPELLRNFPEAEVFAPIDARINEPVRRMREGDHFRVEAIGADFNVMEIPGHTSSHIAYFGAGVIFCGDTLFSLGCGRMFEGTPKEFQASLARIAALPGDTRVCCGHEYTVANGHFATAVDPHNARLRERIDSANRARALLQPTVPSRIEEERACNPFLRLGSNALLDSLTRRHGCAPSDEVEGFSWLRAWKDQFKADLQ